MDMNPPVISLQQSVVPLVESVRQLGVTLSSFLTWSDHVRRLLQRVSFKVFTLKRLAQRTWSAEFVKRLYVGLLRPVLEYGAAVWDGCSKADSLALERVQLSVSCAILRCSRRSCSNNDVLSVLGWPTLCWRRRRHRLLLLWRLIHGGGPPSLRSALPKPSSVRASYSLRNPLSLAFPRCSSARRLRSFISLLPFLYGTISLVPSALLHLKRYFLSP